MTRQTLKNLEIDDVIHGTSCVADDVEVENRVLRNVALFE